MRCKKCNGTGEITVPVEEHMGTVLYGTEQCDECDGTGEVLTNEEYLRSCNTEQLAEFLLEFRFDNNVHNQLCNYLKCNFNGTQKLETLVVEWLKQPHTPKE